ncbi:uncharacterized protein LOC128283645 isoform X2 [Gossypium arboreum]|uniref:uncharacterized protein LOC128283645 isoform X2 n=1 Tax=Gossypium arboreum TaxID=29729 RepID=UPI0022F15071|nr:uncharacterized protein LOC128283645 isoform X2 [Gossypium arboreum]
MKCAADYSSNFFAQVYFHFALDFIFVLKQIYSCLCVVANFVPTENKVHVFSLCFFRSYGKQGTKKKKKNKKIQFSSRETFGLGRSSRVAGKKLRQHHRRRRLKRMETELAKMKAEMRDSAESLMAGPSCPKLLARSQATPP